MGRREARLLKLVPVTHSSREGPCEVGDLEKPPRLSGTSPFPKPRFLLRAQDDVTRFTKCCCFSAESLLPDMEPSKKMESPGTLQTNPPLKLHPDRGAGTSVFVPEQGGYKERFVKTVEDKYKCEKCRLVLCNPKQTECGHRFCETCMAALLRWVLLPASALAASWASPVSPPPPSSLPQTVNSVKVKSSEETQIKFSEPGP